MPVTGLIVPNRLSLSCKSRLLSAPTGKVHYSTAIASKFEIIVRC
jgi:hypothetical protein